jgi:hypothetical protein
MDGIVAKRVADAYDPKHARWHKILNRGYTQRHGRAEWFRERRGRSRSLAKRVSKDAGAAR